jgi:hypothetical protein
MVLTVQFGSFYLYIFTCCESYILVYYEKVKNLFLFEEFVEV